MDPDSSSSSGRPDGVPGRPSGHPGDEQYVLRALPQVDGAGDRTAFEIFLSVVASVPVARAWVGQRMRWLAVQEEVCERVQLLVSELAANAVRHTSSTLFEVHLSLRQEILEVAVHDQDPSRQPQLRRPLPRHTHGRGLAIVDALSDRWGTRRSPAGKSIWFHIDTTLP